MRRRARIEEKLEKLSVADALNAVRFAEVVVVLLDVDNAFEEQDQRIADLVEQEGRAIVIAVNKWDLSEKKPGAIAKLREQAAEKLMQLKNVPLVAVSGLTGEGLDRLMQAIVDAYEVWNRRVPTAALNRWFEDAVSAHPPPAVSGRRLRLNYITQAKTRPPSFVLFCTRADAAAGRLQALSVEFAARQLRSARHADPAHAAREEEPVRGAGEKEALRRGAEDAESATRQPFRRGRGPRIGLHVTKSSSPISKHPGSAGVHEEAHEHVSLLVLCCVGRFWSKN